MRKSNRFPGTGTAAAPRAAIDPARWLADCREARRLALRVIKKAMKKARAAPG